MTQALKLYPGPITAIAPAHFSTLSLVLIGLAVASLIADFGLLVGAVLIR